MAARRRRPGGQNRRSKSEPGSLPDDGKLYYRIGEVARITGVKPYVLRYWESEFRWMSPSKSRANQRLYRRQDIETILLIKRLLYEERFTIEGARKRLRELGRDGAAAELEKAPEAAAEQGVEVAPEPAAPTPEVQRAVLAELKSALEAIRAMV